MIGWFVDGNWTSEWVSAAGVWVGAVGTIATIGWAVITFNHQRHQDFDDRVRREIEERDRLEALAEGVTFTCRVGTLKNQAAVIVGFDVTNGTSEPATVLGLRVAHSELPAVRARPFVVASGTNGGRFDVKPPVPAE